jgi:hypothetical protein
VKPTTPSSHATEWLQRAHALAADPAASNVAVETQLMVLISRAEELGGEIAREETRLASLRADSMRDRSARRLEKLKQALVEVEAARKELAARL